MRCTIDTRSTVSTIRKSLNTLDTYMLSVNCDFEKFNQYVLLQKDALLARGEESSDLLTNLFTAYEAVEDPSFHLYIAGLQDQYNDGRINFEVDTLMETAINKYKMLVKTKKWNSPLAKDAQIVALTALIKKQSTTPKKKKESEKSKDDKKRKQGLDKKWAWKEKNPKDGELKTKKYAEKTYHWCPKHSAWTIHSPKECTKGGTTVPVATKVVSPKKKKSDKILKLTNSLVSIIENAAEDNE